MSAFRWQRLLRLYRWVGIAIGIWLLVMECFDALVTPKPDWLWFGAAHLRAASSLRVDVVGWTRVSE